MPGWTDSTVGITDRARLPVQAQAYLKRIEEVTGVPIHMISTSPDRDHTILIRDPFQP
jgi:adenylosuccinate synthase